MHTKPIGLFLLTLCLATTAAVAGTADSDRLSSDLVGATIVFKQSVTVPAGPRYQSGKLLWNAGPHYVRAWVYPETETGLSLPSGTRARITKVHVDGFSLMGANVKATTSNGDQLSIIFQYASVDSISPRAQAEIPTVGDLKLAFDLVLP